MGKGNNAWRFLKEFLAGPGTTGAIAPSSRALAELITHRAGVETASLVIEFGPGTGIFTEAIQRKLPAAAKFFAIEINPAFVALTRARCPGVVVHEDSAVNTRKHMKAMGAPHCDCVVSGLPWAAFPEALQDELMLTLGDILKPGGVFVTFAYLQGLIMPAGRRFRRKLEERFHRVESSPTIWMNLPPAFVYKAIC